MGHLQPSEKKVTSTRLDDGPDTVISVTSNGMIPSGDPGSSLAFAKGCCCEALIAAKGNSSGSVLSASGQIWEK